MNIYAMNECDWMIGESLDGCIAEYIENYGGECQDNFEDAYELSNEELDSIKFVDAAGDERSFAEQLSIEVSEGGAFPRFFASTEF